MLGMGDARRRVVVELGRLGAAQRGDQPGEDDRHGVAAGVHHAGLAQDREQLRPLLHRLLAGVDRPLQDLGQRGVLGGVVDVGRQPGLGHVGDLRGQAVRHLAHHGEDRALGRVADRLVGPVGGASQGGADQDRVHELARAGDQLLGGAADELGEDDAAVAAGSQQRRARHRLDDLLAADLVHRALAALARQAVELGQHRAHGEDHVVAGVAVGHREDVEVVDLLAARLEVGQGSLDGVAKADEVGGGHGPWRADGAYAAFVTLPAFRQRVHTYTRRGVPWSSMRTFCRFGSNRRLVATIEWLRLCPNAGRLRQE